MQPPYAFESKTEAASGQISGLNAETERLGRGADLLAVPENLRHGDSGPPKNRRFSDDFVPATSGLPMCVAGATGRDSSVIRVRA
jgi:hypothetical protein